MTIDNQHISCIILAGGRGSRMDNSDKGLVQVADRPMIEHVIERIKPQVDDIVISANRNIERYQKYTATVIEDGEIDHTSMKYNGPLSGIASALPACKHDHVLIVPCDMPQLPSELVQQLSAAMGKQTICIARVEQKLQLVFLIHSSLLGSLQQSLTEQKYKLMQWVSSHQPAISDFSDARAFSNINRPEDLINFS